MNNRGIIKIILFILLGLVLILAGITAVSYKWLKNNGLEQIIQSEIIRKQLGDDNEELFKLLPKILGFDQPRTYLLLFSNNTEIRPGGGFIGVYATMRVDKGQMELLALEGTEKIDARTPEEWRPTPPAILQEHLKVDRWYFRDSNWSPDFVASASKALELYGGEGGVASGEIDTVVAFTPTVLEELMRLTGPFTIQGIEFTAENVTEKLEYEVEYGYEDRGIIFAERKQIIEPFMLTLLEHLKNNLFFKLKDYWQLIETMGKEKHIMLYSLNPDLQAEAIKRGWSGQVQQTTGDYLLWVDANLAALKTDHAMARTINYSFSVQPDGRILATATMKYDHQGKFDWRTTRYRTYVRIFVPLGSELIKVAGAMKWDRTTAPGIIDQGEELGKKWFGTFIAIEPGKTGVLSFQYLLPEIISEQIKNSSYTLVVQKQLGTINHGLTLDLNFGKNITGANPPELESEWGDVIYRYSGDLREDREFSINF